jgi:fused signal recognition particle receptor
MSVFDRFRKKAEPPAAPAKPSPPLPDDAAALVVASPAPAETTAASEPVKKGLFARLASGLSKTKQLLNTDIRDLFKREGRLVDDPFLDELFAKLIRTDIGPAATKATVGEVRANFFSRVAHMEDVVATLKNKFKSLLAQEEVVLNFASAGPTVIMICGVNGSGKTTTIAKLTRYFLSQGKSVLLGAGDTFRAAAVEQLTVWANRVGAPIVTGAQGSDPASVAHRAVAAAIEQNIDVCIVDTAGRLQTQKNLMQELSKIHRVVSKLVPEAPHEVLLVLDATAGQNGISQARGFTEAVQCTGLVLAKLDGTAKGGVVIPIRQEFKLPVKFIGLGEKPEDLAVFDPAAFVDALFDEPATAK